MAAFSLLNAKSLTGTSFSALQYVFALDNFAHEYGRDCDTKSDEDTFVSFAHKIGKLAEGETPDHIDGFTGKKPKKNKDTDRIHSNFISAGAVSRSERATNKDPELYPSGSKCLFAISKKVLLTGSIYYEHLDAYLPSKNMKTAFAVWVARDSAFKDALPFAGALKDALSQSYTAELINVLWKDGAPSPNDIGLSNDVFSNEMPRIDWALIGERFPADELGCAHTEAVRASSAKTSSELPNEPRNLIFFGAPGTGKSYQLNEEAKKSFSKKNIRRVTFYPDYTYSQFIGGYRPFPLLGEKGQPTGEITYDFVPGPFLRTYVQAVQNPSTPYLLIIEEINRANAAAVFGDLFQLLDRNEGGRSVYDLSVPVDMQLYLKWRIPEFHTNDQMGTTPEEHLSYYREDTRLLDETMRISIPPNMYIWATMNSADQGVFPMDTAFKRRWDFHYIGINEGADADISGMRLSDIKVPCGKRTVKWNDLRVAINDFLLSDGIHVNEDKLLGPFFISPTSLARDEFTQIFKDKVLLYLYEDAGKTKHTRLFRSDLKTYSQVCEAFQEEGVAIFRSGFPKLEYCPEPEAETSNGPQE